MSGSLIATPASFTLPCVVSPINDMKKSKNRFTKEVGTRAVAFFAASFFQAIDAVWNTMLAVGKFPLATLRLMGVKQLSNYEYSFSAVLQHICKVAKSILGVAIASIGGAIKPDFVYDMFCDVEAESNWMYTKNKLNLNNHFDNITYISLKSRPDRIEKFEKHMKKIDVKSDWFEAVSKNDHKRVVETLERFGVKFDSNMTTEEKYQDIISKVWYHPVRQRPAAREGALGCLLSHLSVWAMQRDKKVQKGLIMEDDCRYVTGSQEVLEKGMKSLPNDWDIAFLGGIHSHPTYKGSDPVLNPRDISGNDEWQKANSLICLHSYVINGKENGRVYDYLIEMVVDALNNASKDRLIQPIDIYVMAAMSPVNKEDSENHTKEWKERNGTLNCYSLKNFIADQQPNKSDIEAYVQTRHMAWPINAK